MYLMHVGMYVCMYVCMHIFIHVRTQVKLFMRDCVKSYSLSDAYEIVEASLITRLTHEREFYRNNWALIITSKITIQQD